MVLLRSPVVLLSLGFTPFMLIMLLQQCICFGKLRLGPSCDGSPGRLFFTGTDVAGVAVGFELCCGSCCRGLPTAWAVMVGLFGFPGCSLV